MKLPIGFLALGLVCFPAVLCAENKHSEAPPFESTWPWLNDLESALEQSRKTGKPILAEFR